MEKPPGHRPSTSGYDRRCHNTSFLEKVTLNPSCQGQDLGQKTLGSYHQKTHGASNTQAWIFGPALSQTNCMSLGKLLNITEPQGFFFFHTFIHQSLIHSTFIQCLMYVRHWNMRIRKMVWLGEGAGDQHSTTRIPINTQLQIVVSAMKEKDWQGLTPRRWHLSWEWKSETWVGSVRKRKYSQPRKQHVQMSCGRIEHTFKALKEVHGAAGRILSDQDEGWGWGWGRVQAIQDSVA